jgi:hypothetical protein
MSLFWAFQIYYSCYDRIFNPEILDTIDRVNEVKPTRYHLHQNGYRATRSSRETRRWIKQQKQYLRQTSFPPSQEWNRPQTGQFNPLQTPNGERNRKLARKTQDASSSKHEQYPGTTTAPKLYGTLQQRKYVCNMNYMATHRPLSSNWISTLFQHYQDPQNANAEHRRKGWKNT